MSVDGVFIQFVWQILNLMVIQIEVSRGLSESVWSLLIPM